jgi:hypothetical protein
MKETGLSKQAEERVANAKKTIEAAVKAFTATLYDAAATAAELYVKTVDVFPESRQAFAEAVPAFRAAEWRMIEAIGRKTIQPKMLYGQRRDLETADKIAHLPVADQKKIVDTGVKVLAADGTHIMATVERMTPLQKKMVLANGRVRTLSEQKAWLETEKIKEAEAVKKNHHISMLDDYVVERGVVKFLKPRSYTVAELLKIMMEMQK